MEMKEEFITYICHKLAEECEKELKKLRRDPQDLLKIKPHSQESLMIKQ